MLPLDFWWLRAYTFYRGGIAPEKSSVRKDKNKEYNNLMNVIN